MRGRASETFERRRTHSHTSERHEASSSRKGAIMSDSMNNPYVNNPIRTAATDSSRKVSRNTGHTRQISNRKANSRAAIPTIRAIRIRASRRPHATLTAPTPTKTRTRTASSTRATPPANRTDSRTANQGPATTTGSQSARSNLRRNGCQRKRRTRSAAPTQYLASPPSSSAWHC